MNKITKTLIRYEWTAFIRNRFQLLMIALTFAFGLYAIYYGQSEINAQRKTIRAVQALELDEFSSYKSSFTEEMETLAQKRSQDIASNPAYAWYRHGYHAILPPHDYAPLAIGQRDLFRYYYRLTGMSLHYQLFENELANPVNLMAGNFDLSFVLVYLFPLLIIAFCYGLFASDQENGTLALLQIQAVSIQKIVLTRLFFYFALVTALALLLSLIGLLTSGNPFLATNRAESLSWLAAVTVYCAFWFGLMLWIISFRKSSSFNAITAAGCWLWLLIIIPAVLNVMVTVKYPLNSATLAGLTRRTGLENENDEEESKEVIMEFLAHKPALKGSDSLLKNNMLPKTYAAFTSLKDVHNQELVDQYNEQVTQRSDWTSGLQWLSPAVNMQDILSRICQTDVHTFLIYQDALVDFHQEITDFYFTRLFWDKPISLEDYAKLPSFDMPHLTGQMNTVWAGIFKLFVASTLVFVWGYFRMYDNSNQ